MISLLFALLIAAIVFYVVYYVLGMIALPAPIKTIVYLIIGIIFLFYILNMLGMHVGGGV